MVKYLTTGWATVISLMKGFFLGCRAVEISPILTGIRENLLITVTINTALGHGLIEHWDDAHCDFNTFSFVKGTNNMHLHRSVHIVCNTSIRFGL